MTKIMRRFVGLVIFLACGLGTAWAGAPRSIPRTLPGGAVLTPDTKHICGPGGYLLYVFPDGSRQCMHPSQLPPRSQADCPPGTKFMVIHKWPVCDNPRAQFPALHAGEPGPAPPPCRTDADCPRGGVCYPMGGGMCGSPPISR